MYHFKMFIIILARIVEYSVLIRCLLSFVPNLSNSKFADVIYQVTDPILVPCNRLLDRLGLNNGMIDFSPIVAFLLISILINLVIYI